MNRPRAVVAVALVAAGLGWVAWKGLGDNLVYFKTPSEIVREGVVGERVRLGGQVQPGSVERLQDAVRFVVTDGTTRVTVIDTGGLPSLFREGQGVVAEGFYGRDGAFHADTILIKHSEVYRTPEPGKTPRSAELEGA